MTFPKELDRLAEIASIATVSAATTAGAMTEANFSGLVVPLISGGIAAIVGYFSARMTIEREVGVLNERESNHFHETQRVNLEMVRRLDSIDKKLEAVQEATYYYKRHP